MKAILKTLRKAWHRERARQRQVRKQAIHSLEESRRRFWEPMLLEESKRKQFHRLLIKTGSLSPSEIAQLQALTTYFTQPTTEYASFGD